MIRFLCAMLIVLLFQSSQVFAEAKDAGTVDMSLANTCLKVAQGDRSQQSVLAKHLLVQKMSEGMREQVRYSPSEFAESAFSNDRDPRFSWDRLRAGKDQIEPFVEYVSSNASTLLISSLAESSQYLDVALKPSDIRINIVCGGPWDAYVLSFNDKPEIFFDIGWHAEKDKAKMISDFKAILTHELWHANLQKQIKEKWRQSYKLSSAPSERFIYEMFNEGIAHFYSIKPRLMPTIDYVDFDKRQADIFRLLAEKYPVYRTTKDAEELRKLLWNSHAGVPFWQKWGAVAGALMTYRMQSVLDNSAFRTLTSNEPFSFVVKYAELSQSRNDWPKLPDELIQDANAALKRHESERKFNRDAWLADYQQLQDHVSKVYANFHDKVQAKVVDPFKLRQSTINELKSAQSDKQALAAILRFVGSFQDGHFKVANLKEAAPKYIPHKTVYPLKLGLLGQTPVVKSLSDSQCTIPVGSEVVSINGLSVAKAMLPYESLTGIGNETLRRDRALGSIAAGGFAPEEKLVLEAKIERGIARCEFLPQQEPWPSDPTPVSSESNLTAQTAADAACSAMNISDRDAEFGFRLSKLDGFSPVANQSYRAGILRQPGSSPVGFVRIHAFGEFGYLQVCKEEWNKYKATLSAACDADCQWEFQYRRMIPRLIEDARKLIDEFKERGITSIVLDVTGNGGGGDWVDIIARMFAPKPQLHCQALRRIKHPKTLASYESMLSEVDADLQSATINDSDKATLRKAKEILRALIAESRASCDLNGYWKTPKFKPTCNILGKPSEHACGLFAYLPPDSLAKASSKQALFKSLDQPYSESLFKGHLFVVMDRYTSSSAEYFVSMLRDAGVASVIGEHSNSTGCGYINGGVPVKLKHSGLEIKMSTCARFRKDGRNEVFGIEPDITIPWVGDDPEEATRKLIEVIQKKKSAE